MAAVNTRVFVIYPHLIDRVEDILIKAGMPYCLANAVIDSEYGAPPPEAPDNETIRLWGLHDGKNVPTRLPFNRDPKIGFIDPMEGAILSDIVDDD